MTRGEAMAAARKRAGLSQQELSNAAAERLLGPDAAADLSAPDPAAEGRFRLDLPGVVMRRLIQLGLRKENIQDLGECTMCRPDKYWSHRSMGLARGSQANIIML